MKSFPNPHWPEEKLRRYDAAWARVFQGMDPELKFNEQSQMYTSSLGYFIEDNLDRHCIEGITIYVKELNTPAFKAGNW